MRNNIQKTVAFGKLLFKRLCIFFAFTGWLISCNTTDTPEDALLTNGSFESGGSFSTDGWSTNGGQSSTDVPSGGGSFSLRLDPQSVPQEGYAEYSIQQAEGSQSYTITAYIKSVGTWPGTITIKKREADNTVTILASTNSADAEWVQKTLSVSSTFASGDELIIKLSAGSTEIPTDTKYALFDLITIE